MVRIVLLSGIQQTTLAEADGKGQLLNQESQVRIALPATLR